MPKPKILVLVLAVDFDPWRRIEIEGQDSTWKCHCPDNLTILRYTGKSPTKPFWKFLNSIWIWNGKIRDISGGRITLFSINAIIGKAKFLAPKVDLDNHTIHTNVPEHYSLIGKKTLEAFEACVENLEFDYIYRTNVSSYLDLPGMNGFIESKPLSNFYAGTIGNHQGVNFASGSGYFISRDLVIEVIRNQKFWDHNLIDDVSLGKLFETKLKIGIEEVKRTDIDSTDTLSQKIAESSSVVFHYRCKSDEAGTTIQIMKSIDALISER